MPKSNAKTFLQEVILAIAPVYVNHGLTRISKEAEEVRRSIDRGVAPNDELGRKKAQEDFAIWLVPYIEEQVQTISRGCLSMAQRIATAADLIDKVPSNQPVPSDDGGAPAEDFETVTVKK